MMTVHPFTSNRVVTRLQEEHPKKVAQKVCEAAGFAVKRVREFYQAGEPKDDRPGEGAR